VFLFLTHMTTDTLLSDTLLSDQDHQEVGPLLLAFVQSYSLLMTGLPRMMPHPTLPSAHITRRKLLGHLDKLLDATEDSELQNELLAARARMLDDHMAPRSIRVIELLRLLHGLNMPHVLAFWMLLHIISDVELLEHVRTETKHLIKASQDAPVMGFSVPPRVRIDASALLGPSAPVLQRCWLETARLYSRGQNSWVATEDFDLEGDDGGIFKGKEKWRVNKGDWIDVPYWLGNNDGVLWEEPEKWNPHRHVTEEGKDMIFDTMVFDAPGLLGMDEGTRPARLFALAFVAIAIVLFDFETDIEKGIPKPQFSAGVALPDGDVRVRIRKRVLA
jgi:cytochrome P450